MFLTTDGVSDNFDPVVRKEALPSPLPHPRGYVDDSDSDTPMSPQEHEEKLALPFLTPPERHDHSLKLMANVIHRFSNNDFSLIDAANVATHLVTDSYRITENQRLYLEKHILPNDCTSEERRQNYREIKKTLKKLPGKLDHATAVAYQVIQLGGSCVPVETKKRKVPKAKSLDCPPKHINNDDQWTEFELETKSIDVSKSM